MMPCKWQERAKFGQSISNKPHTIKPALGTVRALWFRLRLTPRNGCRSIPGTRRGGRRFPGRLRSLSASPRRTQRPAGVAHAQFGLLRCYCRTLLHSTIELLSNFDFEAVRGQVYAGVSQLRTISSYRDMPALKVTKNSCNSPVASIVQKH